MILFWSYPLQQDGFRLLELLAEYSKFRLDQVVVGPISLPLHHHNQYYIKLWLKPHCFGLYLLC